MTRNYCHFPSPTTLCWKFHPLPSIRRQRVSILIVSNPIVSHSIESHRIESHRIPSYRIPSYRIPSYRIPSYPTVSNPIVSNPIESHIKSHLIGKTALKMMLSIKTLFKKQKKYWPIFLWFLLLSSNRKIVCTLMDSQLKFTINFIEWRVSKFPARFECRQLNTSINLKNDKSILAECKTQI